MLKNSLRQIFLNDRFEHVLRWILFLYVAAVLCPIRYLEFHGKDVDNTWLFALNYGAAQHLVMGRDLAWTTGPLAYLAAPLDIGHNLAHGLLFQAAIWVLLIAILRDLFFRSSFPLKNLAFFSVFMGLSSPQYHELPNPLAAGTLLFDGALILLTHYRLRGGRTRYITALVMLGLVPLIQFVGVMLAAGVVAGLIVGQFVLKGAMAIREVALAVLVPACVAAVGYALTVGSWSAFTAYVRSSAELASGYNLAMSLRGPPAELIAGLEAIALLAVYAAAGANANRQTSVFFGLLFAVPLVVSMKHSFVRQDQHSIYILSLAAFATGLVALASQLDKFATRTVTNVTFLMVVLCLLYVVKLGPRAAIADVTGSQTMHDVWRVFRFPHLRQELAERSLRNFDSSDRVEPEITAMLKHEPVGSLSVMYSSYLMDGLNLALSPVVQRYSAYTPYLDRLNAEWVRTKAPRFLIFDGKSIDGRHAWTETPATWAEIYRLYDTRFLGAHNLLLERRDAPRFTQLETLTRERMRFGDELRIPASPEPIFWSMNCSLTEKGELRKLLFRVSDVTMTVYKSTGQNDTFRVLPSVLGSPSIGNYLPGSLIEFAAVLAPDHRPDFSVEKLTFGGPGTLSYSPVCDVEFLRQAH